MTSDSACSKKCSIGLTTCGPLRQRLGLTNQCESCDETAYALEEQVESFTKDDVQLLASSGASVLASAFDKVRPFPTQPHKCPAHGHTLHSPCELTGCKYHVMDATSGNCLVHLAQQGDMTQGTAFSVEEIANLMGLQEKQVRALLKSGQRKVGCNFLRTEIQSGELERNLLYLPNTRLCVVCEKHAPPGSTFVEFSGSRYFYCSQDCQVSHPPLALKLELELQVSFSELLKFVLSKFRAENSVQKLLGVSRAQLRQLITKYVSVDTSAGSASRAALTKRTWHYPIGVDVKVETVLNKELCRLEAEYGISVVDVSPIYLDLDRLIPKPSKRRGKQLVKEIQ